MVESIFPSSARTRRSRWRVTVAGVAAAAAFASVMVAQPAQATPKPVTYLETNCVVKSVVKNGGPHGDGCVTWGVPHTVTVGAPHTSPLPPQILQLAIGCGQEGLMEFVKEWNEVEEAPPQYTKAIAAAYLAIGCFQGVAEALDELKH
ncbi:hypothetical protein [Nocardia nova]|uniref:hypothetical protein n=1 Tax=Nocardia nova TaxID=37330 RepID=UPI0011B0CD53|nr:hypothetical protein [Nocardia nova]